MDTYADTLTNVTLSILAVVAVALFGTFVWPTRFSYETTKTGENALTIRVDRFSEKTWMFLPGAGWVPPQVQTKKPQQLPTIDGIGGYCSLDEFGGHLTCDISNNTDYTIESVKVGFNRSNGQIGSAKMPDGRRIFVASSCIAELRGAVEPRTMVTMSVTPPCGHDLKPYGWTWSILSASGSKS